MKILNLFTVLTLIGISGLYADSNCSSCNYDGYNDWRGGNIQGNMAWWNAKKSNDSIMETKGSISDESIETPNFKEINTSSPDGGKSWERSPESVRGLNPPGTPRSNPRFDGR